MRLRRHTILSYVRFGWETEPTGAADSGGWETEPTRLRYATVIFPKIDTYVYATKRSIYFWIYYNLMITKKGAVRPPRRDTQNLDFKLLMLQPQQPRCHNAQRDWRVG